MRINTIQGHENSISKNMKGITNNTPKAASASNNVSFGLSVSGKDILHKIGKAYEFDKFNFSLIGLMTICYGAVEATRYAKSRDDVERRDILIRDTLTISTIIFGRRAIQNIVSRLCSKATGFALHTKPENHSGTWQKVYNYLRPEKGIKPLSSEEIVAKYGNIHHYKNGILDFCDFITTQGGDVKKVLSYDDKIKKHMSNAYNEWVQLCPATSKRQHNSFEKAEPTEIVDMLKFLNKPGESQNKNIKAIEDNLANIKNNKLIQKARFMNSGFDFLTTFVVVPITLGWITPSINEYITKHFYMKKKPKPEVENNVQPANTQQSTSV